MSESGYPVLIIGLEERTAETVESHLAGATITRIQSADDFTATYEKWADGMFAAIFAGPALSGVTTVEVAQVLQTQCPATPKFFVTLDNTTFEARNLVKNGFNEVFLLPMDALVLKKTIVEKIVTGAKTRSFKSVRIFDIEAGAKLDFEMFVYLPLNNKYVKYTSANQEIDSTKLSKLTEHQVNSVFVDHKDMDKFYQYAAKKLQDPGSGHLSATERQEKLRESVRSIFSDIFDQSIKADFNEGKEVIDNCTKIISNFITKGSSGDWYKRLMTAMGDTGDTYNHATNVSTFAALFAIGVGHPNPEDLAMAGLFHDIGLTALPDAIVNKPESEMTDEEKNLYYSHPEKSLNIVKNKRIILSPEVEKAILQHHEKFSGKGYPKQLPGNRLSTEAQILSFADQFDYLTRLEEGRQRLAPIDAWQEIKRTGSIDPELLSKLRRLIEKETPAEVKKPA